MRPTSLDIRTKLASLAFAVAGVAVVSLTIYFSARQASATEAALQAKALTFARLMALDAQSAVAFDDRQTAREVVESAAQDPDVQAVLLVGPDDEVLAAAGEPTTRPSSGSADVPAVVASPGVIAVTAQVVTKEGPRGRLLVELSTKSIASEKARIRSGAVVAGLVALLAGLVASWFIGGSFAKRVRRIGAAAQAFGEGARDVDVLADRSQDEIGELARAFDSMAVRLRELVTRIESQGREEADRLDRIVIERTAELRERNADLAFVLDNVGHGFLTVCRAGRVTRRQSAVLDKWFSGAGDDATIWELVAARDAQAALTMELGWETVFDDSLPVELAVDQLPKRVRLGETTLSVHYQPILNGADVEKVIVVVTDVSDEVARERAEASQKELASVFARLVTDPRSVQQFLVEGNVFVRLLSDDSAGAVSLVDQKRWLHTLKGNAGFFGLTRLHDLCHDMESGIVESGERPSASSRARLQALWTELTSSLATFVPQRVDSIELSRQAVLEHVEAIHRGRARTSLAAAAKGWLLESAELPLQRAAAQARSVAERLGKSSVEIVVDAAADVRLDSATWGPFWGAFVHVVRNAIDHGIEDADERLLANKAGAGKIVLRATRTKVDDVIEIEDDGRGIDWDALEERARSLGIAIPTEREALLFVDGLSTRTEVTHVSGRGVGLGACRAAVLALGGSVEVTSLPGVGTGIRFRVPKKHPAVRRAS